MKSKDKLVYSKKEERFMLHDPSHEAQFNTYVWLLADGTFLDTNEPCNVTITRGGMHYLTWSTKKGMQFRKHMYKVWTAEETEQFIVSRLAPLVEWRRTRILPSCNPYNKGFWECGCSKVAAQLEERGIYVNEHHPIEDE